MKNNLLVPIAGLAKRFSEKGYRLPKPMITVGAQMMIDLAMDSVDFSQSNLVFIVREDHIREFSIDKVLRSKFGSEIKILDLDQLTKGTLCTCLLAKDLIEKELSTWIYTPDVAFPMVSLEIPEGLDGYLYTFKANNPAHSYCRLENGLVIEVKEKSVISDKANVGVYGWKSGYDFIKYSEQLINAGDTTNGEYYVAPVFNYLIKDNKKIGCALVEKFYCLGTPEDVSFFERRVLPVFGDKPIALCSDHSGFRTKEQVKKIIWSAENQYGTPLTEIDFGCYSLKDCDLIDFLTPALRHIQTGVCDFAVASCRTANGMVMAANKFNGINAVIVHDEFTAQHAIRHNAANVFCIPERGMTEYILHKILRQLLINTPDGGRFSTRLMKLENEQK